jgi:hypothetical protein
MTGLHPSIHHSKTEIILIGKVQFSIWHIVGLCRWACLCLCSFICSSRQSALGSHLNKLLCYGCKQCKLYPRQSQCALLSSRYIITPFISLYYTHSIQHPHVCGRKLWLCLSCVHKTSDKTEELMFSLIAGQPLGMSWNKPPISRLVTSLYNKQQDLVVACKKK